MAANENTKFQINYKLSDGTLINLYATCVPRRCIRLCRATCDFVLKPAWQIEHWNACLKLWVAWCSRRFCPLEKLFPQWWQ